MSLSPIAAAAIVLASRKVNRASAIWTPAPENRPQQLAYNSPADVLGYGGSAGGGKTELILGLAFTRHQRSVIYRLHYRDFSGAIRRGNEIAAGTASYISGGKKCWELPGGKFIELRAVQYIKDIEKFQGNPCDLIAIDEAQQFRQNWYHHLTGWLRSEDPDQRTRIVLAFNPPTSADGEWIVRYFGPWLNEEHPDYPTAPGDLLWYIRVGDEDVRVENGDPVDIDGERHYPQSRTFIPARVTDNPYYGEEYIAQLQSLPEPLRSQLLYGDFALEAADDPWQAIPTAWIAAAQRRWAECEKPPVDLRAYGVDVARGGKDNTVIQKLYGTWFDEPVKLPGRQTPDGQSAAREVLTALGNENAPGAIDVIGIGASAYDQLKDMAGINIDPVNFGEGSPKVFGAPTTDRSGKFQFLNMRAYCYWKLREALDPESGEEIALPPGRDVRVELMAPRYQLTGGKIKVEPKDNIKERIGRSPDIADGIALAWYVANQPVLVPGRNMNG
jgi:hypothetical protein